MARTSRPAFTLIELLVVIGITAILMALLVPAVQKVREAASRLRCENNLKQIGLAFHQYHDDFKRFPPGFTSAAASPDEPGLGPGWGWAAHILPYVEQESLYRRIDFTKDISNPVNAFARVQSLKVFLCPSDGPARLTFTAVDDGGGPLCDVAFANYVGMGGTNEVTVYPDTGGGLEFQGVLLRNSRVRFGDILDGSSHTLMVGERASRKSPMTTWVGAVTNSVNPPLILGYDEEGPPTLVLTNTGTAADGRVPNNILDHVEDANSNHPQGVNFLFADGSVRIINNKINPAVWAAMGTRAGGEAVNPEDF